MGSASFVLQQARIVLRCDSIAWECILCVVKFKWFILAFDNVWEWNCGNMYLRQIALWRKALNDLPTTAAYALAHKKGRAPLAASSREAGPGQITASFTAPRSFNTWAYGSYPMPHQQRPSQKRDYF